MIVKLIYKLQVCSRKKKKKKKKQSASFAYKNPHHNLNFILAIKKKKSDKKIGKKENLTSIDLREIFWYRYIWMLIWVHITSQKFF